MTKGYNADSIQSLSQIQHLRKRPSLTFGRETGSEDNPYSSMKSVALREIIDNSVDEIKAGHGNKIKVTIYEDGSFECYDSGRGLPVDIGRTSEGKEANGIYLTMGILNSGGKFSTDSKRFSSGLNGLGASATQMMSEAFLVTVYRDKKEYKLHFSNGEPGFFEDEENPKKENFAPAKNLKEIRSYKDTRSKEEKKNFPTGTKIRVFLNNEAFPSRYPVDYDDLIDRLRGTAFLVPNITIEVVNHLRIVDNEPQKESFHFDNGITELAELNRYKDPVSDFIHIKTSGEYVEKNVSVLQDDGTFKTEDVDRVVLVETVIGWDVGFDYSMSSFVNTIRTRLGGVHENAFERAMTSSFTKRFRGMRGLFRSNEEDPIFEDFSEGLTAVLSVQISEPEFTGQSKEELGGRAAQKAIQDALEKAFTEWLDKGSNYDAVKTIGSKVYEAYQIRKKEREERELKREKSRLKRSAKKPTKLLDCEINYEPESELYIVEGDSALGALKGVRNSSHQALLPIRGKILNILKASPTEILNNAEVQDITNALDAGFGEDFKVENARYQNIFIAADADYDGDNIACLLVLLIAYGFPDFIRQGRLYRILTPLYVIHHKDESIYAYTEKDKDEILQKMKEEGVLMSRIKIDRNKGLGESGDEVLFDTGMSSESRIVIQITSEDVEESKAALEVALGKDVAPRKEWIDNNPIELIIE